MMGWVILKWLEIIGINFCVTEKLLETTEASAVLQEHIETSTMVSRFWHISNLWEKFLFFWVGAAGLATNNSIFIHFQKNSHWKNTKPLNSNWNSEVGKTINKNLLFNKFANDALFACSFYCTTMARQSERSNSKKLFVWTLWWLKLFWYFIWHQQLLAKHNKAFKVIPIDCKTSEKLKEMRQIYLGRVGSFNKFWYFSV